MGLKRNKSYQKAVIQLEHNETAQSARIPVLPALFF